MLEVSRNFTERAISIKYSNSILYKQQSRRKRIGIVVESGPYWIRTSDFHVVDVTL